MLQKNTFLVQSRKINMRHVTSKVLDTEHSTMVEMVDAAHFQSWRFLAKSNDRPIWLEIHSTILPPTFIQLTEWLSSLPFNLMIQIVSYNFNHNFWVRIQVQIIWTISDSMAKSRSKSKSDSLSESASASESNSPETNFLWEWWFDF